MIAYTPHTPTAFAGVDARNPVPDLLAALGAIASAANEAARIACLTLTVTVAYAGLSDYEPDLDYLWEIRAAGIGNIGGTSFGRVNTATAYLVLSALRTYAIAVCNEINDCPLLHDR